MSPKLLFSQSVCWVHCKPWSFISKSCYENGFFPVTSHVSIHLLTYRTHHLPRHHSSQQPSVHAPSTYQVTSTTRHSPTSHLPPSRSLTTTYRPIHLPLTLYPPMHPPISPITHLWCLGTWPLLAVNIASGSSSFLRAVSIRGYMHSKQGGDFRAFPPELTGLGIRKALAQSQVWLL